jgi:hypothetical protein
MARNEKMSFIEDMAQQRKYLVEDACRTLEKAKEIQADPELMKEVKDYAAKKAGTFRSIADLKAARDKAIAADNEEGSDAEEATESPEEEATEDEGSEEMPTEEGQLPKQLEENTYIARVEAVKKEAKKPSVAMVKEAE